MVEKRGADPALVARLRAALGARPRLLLAVLFGSASSGRDRADSDIDVAILAGPGGLDDPSELSLSRALALAGRANVDLIRIERASTLLRWQIATTGVLLVEGSPGTFARFRAQAASDYIDFGPALAHYGEIFRRRLIRQGPAR